MRYVRRCKKRLRVAKFDKVKVGGYTIRRRDKNSVWIQTEDGEGGQFSDASFF